ncbi:MAG: DUF1540 domain-containing protein [Eubacterium sp.]|nr:DUF1540 domain-containing protein [Eubacterium sp.]
MSEEIKGIRCNAEKCIYHDKSDKCTAGHIDVGCQSATDSSQTKCETFECCNECK